MNEFIAACKASIAAHEANILKAINRNDNSAVAKLNGYRVALLARIAEAEKVEFFNYLEVGDGPNDTAF